MIISIYFTKRTVKRLYEHLKKAYSLGDLRLVRRIHALLSVSEGKSIPETAKNLGVSIQSIYNWINEFILKGAGSLKYKKSPGRPSKLTKTQKQSLCELIKAGPLKAGYLSACWSSVIIADLIYHEFRVLYNSFYICTLMRNLGFSYQKAKYTSEHLDMEKRQVWMREEWPKILKEAKEKNAVLLFEDESSFPQWGSLSYTWAVRGEQPIVPTYGKRKGYKVFGAIDFFTGELFYQGITGKFNSDSYQAFLLNIIEQTKKSIVLIQDGAKYHTSKATKGFFDQHKDRLTVYQLPSYSPDYNPIEFMWKKIKTRATHNRYFPEFELLIQSIDFALEYLSKNPNEILGLMGAYTKEMDSGSVA